MRQIMRVSWVAVVLGACAAPVGTDVRAETVAVELVSGPCGDGVLNTGDDQPIQIYNQNQTGTVTSPVTKNVDLLARRYRGLDFTVTRRKSGRWQLLAGYTFSTTKVDATSISTPNNAFVNAAGEDGGRRHNFKATGSYDLPYGISFGFGFRMNSGLPVTRTWQIQSCSATVLTNCVRQAAITVNAEPRGSVLLPAIHTLDLRGGKRFRVGSDELELSFDVYNATNANTTFAIRSTTGLSSIRPAGHPAAPTQSIASWMSPTNVLAPRVGRFNISYRF